MEKVEALVAGELRRPASTPAHGVERELVLMEQAEKFGKRKDREA